MFEDLNERLKVVWDDGEVRLTFVLCAEAIVDGERRMRAAAKALRRWAQKLDGVEIEFVSGIDLLSFLCTQAQGI